MARSKKLPYQPNAPPSCLTVVSGSTTFDSDNGIGCFRPTLTTPCLLWPKRGRKGVVNGAQSYDWPIVKLDLPSRVSRVRIPSPAPNTPIPRSTRPAGIVRWVFIFAPATPYLFREHSGPKPPSVIHRSINRRRDNDSCLSQSHNPGEARPWNFRMRPSKFRSRCSGCSNSPRANRHGRSRCTTASSAPWSTRAPGSVPMPLSATQPGWSSANM